MATDNKSFMDDRESLQALVDLLSPELRKEYQGYASLVSESAFPGRRFVVYTLKDGRPTDIEFLTFGRMSMGDSTGPAVEFTSDRRSDVEIIGMVPTKIHGRELFLHIPQKFEFRWKGKRSSRPGAEQGVNFAPHYAVLIKTRNKAKFLVDDQTYCVRLNEFREMFPELKVGY